MPAKQKTLDDLFLHTLKDIYYAEKKILRNLRTMEKAAEAEELRQAFVTHRAETEGQIERLEQVFELLGKPARGVTCEAINGILQEGESILEDFGESEAADASLVAAAQAVEHYEISSSRSSLRLAPTRRRLSRSLSEPVGNSERRGRRAPPSWHYRRGLAYLMIAA
jgi:ferritin-like metal-binding protein YciE